VLGIRPFTTTGFVVVRIPPVDEIVGIGEPQGKTNTSHWVSFGEAAVHPMVILVAVIDEATSELGRIQVGAGPQVIFAVQPAATTEPSLRKRKVKQPSGAVDVNSGKLVPVNVPQKPPGTPPGTFPAGFALIIMGAVIEFPSKTYKASQLVSVTNEVKVTVTVSPAFVGQMVVVESVLFA